MGRCNVDTCFTFVLFIIGAFFFFLAILTFISSQSAETSRKRFFFFFFSVRMLEKIILQGRSVAIRLRQKCQYFQGNHKKKKNTEKDKVVKLWNKNVQSNKSLAN